MKPSFHRFPARHLLPCALCAFLLLVSHRTARAAAPPAAPAADPQRQEQLFTFLQSMVDEILPYSKKDKDLKALLEKNKLDKSVDWESYHRDSKKTEAMLTSLATELVELAKANAHAREIVEKFNIKLNPGN